MNRFYVYEWFVINTNKVFYVGKGTGNRMNVLYNRNIYFKNVYNKYDCDVRVYKDNLSEEKAYAIEEERIAELWDKGEAQCNLTEGGTGFASGELNPTVQNPHYGDSNGMHTQNIDFTGENNPFYGRKHSRETKKKISDARKGKGGLPGENNPMHNSGHKVSGSKNGMFGVRGIKHPNATIYKVFFLNSSEYELLTYKQCEKRFGTPFYRVSKKGGILNYKKKSKNSHHDGRKIVKLGKVNQD